MYVLDIGSETTYAMRAISDAFVLVYSGSTPSNRAVLCTAEANFNLGMIMSRAYVDDFFPLLAKDEVT